MNQVEAIIVLLLLFMAVPDICRKLKRPALIYSAYVMFGILLGPWLHIDVKTMLQQAGHVGFLLLLFEVGMEIELPRLGRLIRPVRNAIVLALLQIPAVLAAGYVAGFTLSYSFMAAAALTGCSVGMAHAAWKAYPGLTDLIRKRLLRTMVALELWSILALVLGGTFLKGKFDTTFGITLLGIIGVLFLIAQFGSKLVPVFEWIITRTTHWRVHLLVLLILIVCTVGERIGLGGPKTAFFLGLAMNQTRHRGMNLDDYMAPISQRFLIPIFFVALGLQIRWLDIIPDRFEIESLTGVLAFGTAGLLLGIRMLIHNRLLKIGGDKNAFLLLSPNLTMVALAATSLIQYAHAEKVATWLLLTGLFMTVPSILFLPTANNTDATQQKNASPKPTSGSAPDATEGPKPEAGTENSASGSNTPALLTETAVK